MVNKSFWAPSEFEIKERPLSVLVGHGLLALVWRGCVASWGEKTVNILPGEGWGRRFLWFSSRSRRGRIGWRGRWWRLWCGWRGGFTGLKTGKHTSHTLSSPMGTFQIRVGRSTFLTQTHLPFFRCVIWTPVLKIPACLWTVCWCSFWLEDLQLQESWIELMAVLWDQYQRVNSDQHTPVKTALWNAVEHEGTLGSLCCTTDQRKLKILCLDIWVWKQWSSRTLPKCQRCLNSPTSHENDITKQIFMQFLIISRTTL